MSLTVISTIVILIIMFLASALRVLNEYERAVVFRLGDHRPRGRALILIRGRPRYW